MGRFRDEALGSDQHALAAQEGLLDGGGQIHIHGEVVEGLGAGAQVGVRRTDRAAVAVGSDRGLEDASYNFV